jgi:hypothetical protein
VEVGRYKDINWRGTLIGKQTRLEVVTAEPLLQNKLESPVDGVVVDPLAFKAFLRACCHNVEIGKSKTESITSDVINCFRRRFYSSHDE